MTEQLKTVPGLFPATENDGTEPIGGAGSFDEVFAQTDELFAQTVVLDGAPGVTPAEKDVPPPRELQPGSVLRDRYRLLEKVAGGSMGTVFKAVDGHLAGQGEAQSLVAIKVLSANLVGHPDALRALQQEAAKGRCLNHPNIVRFLDLDKEGQQYFLVLEWIEGRSLADLLDDGELGNDIDQCLHIVRQLGDALHYAHQRGVVHADVKPGNVMLTPDGTVKLVDFGISHALYEEEDFRPALLQAGTPAYCSMQVLTGETPAPADDVYSLACLVYRMVAGHRVFGPRNAAEAAEAGMEPAQPAALNDSQWRALKKALSFARVTRQSSPRELVDGLLQGGGTSPATAPPVTPALPEVEHEPLSLSIPEEEVLARRFDTPTSRWPKVMLALLLGAVAAVGLHPEWRAAAMAAWAAAKAEIDRASQGAAEINDPVSNPANVTPAPEPAAALPTAGTSTAEAAEAEPVAIAEPVPTAPVASPPARAESERSAGVEAAVPAAQRLTPGGDLYLPPAGSDSISATLQLTEGSAPAELRLVRAGDSSSALLLRIEEVGFSGSRSPGDAGVYTLSGDGVVSFDPGQRDALLTIRTRDDNRHAQDQQVSLLVRDFYNPESVVARIDLQLLDDDQRAFEARLPLNAVGFVRDEIVVSERAPAVQIDLIRYNPDAESLVIAYTMSELGATEGVDYFVPGRQQVTFGPGQRNARLLVPLVQDAIAELDESFRIDLVTDVASGEARNRVTVTIRDDDGTP